MTGSIVDLSAGNSVTAHYCQGMSTPNIFIFQVLGIESRAVHIAKHILC
jgi:hypothetical protein